MRKQRKSTAALPGMTHYRLVEHSGRLPPSPTVWIAECDGKVVFDQRSYDSGLVEAIVAVVDRQKN
ncbi:MAG: hypothetical protein VB144_08080 [Clostridia bacterium]|nr:hypothetical protein [Clostridia bacterium]